MVGLGRLELPTSPLSGVRSNQLSYKPITCFCFLPYAAPLFVVCSVTYSCMLLRALLIRLA